MGDIEKQLNRVEIARRDCVKCRGAGWTGSVQDQNLCDVCGGTGFEEKEVPYDFALGRTRTPGQLREIAFGEAPPQKLSIEKDDLI